VGELVETTNWGMTKRHLAEPSALRACSIGGREGLPLCSRNYTTWDQEYKDTFHGEYHWKLGPRISALPLCKRCESKAANR
jgi:hypothetical protein